MSRWQDSWEGWHQAPDEYVEEREGVPTKLKKSTRSVGIHLTVERCERLLPALTQLEWIRPSTLELDAIPLLAQLPNLTGVDLHQVDWSKLGPEEERDALIDEAIQRVAALPRLRSLCAAMSGSALAHLRSAKGLRWLRFWLERAEEVTEEQLAHLGELSHLEELKLITSAKTTPSLGPAALRALASHGRLRDVRLEVDLTNDALEVLFAIEGLEQVVLRLPGTQGQRVPAEIRIRDKPALSRLEVSALGSVHLSRLPALRHLMVSGINELSLEELPRLGALSLYSVKRLTLRDLPSLRRLHVEIGPERFEVAGAPKLREVRLPHNGLDEAARETLRAALPEAKLTLTDRRPKKRKRTAEKRKLAPKAWKHPKLGFSETTYAALVVGRAYTSDLAVKKLKELGTVAEFWSLERGEHLSAFAPYHVSPNSGIASTDDIGPIVIGRVVALVSADEGPSAPIELAALRPAPLPAELWAELAGVIGDDLLEQAEDAVHLVPTGPLATAMLAHGELKPTDSPEVPTNDLIIGTRSDQTSHDHGVLGTLIEASIEDVVPIELDELPAGPGQLYLISRYD